VGSDTEIVLRSTPITDFGVTVIKLRVLTHKKKQSFNLLVDYKLPTLMDWFINQPVTDLLTNLRYCRQNVIVTIRRCNGTI